MERFRYWIKRIMDGKWKQCRSFCVKCQYYYECVSDSVPDLGDSEKRVKTCWLSKIAGR